MLKEEKKDTPAYHFPAVHEVKSLGACLPHDSLREGGGDTHVKEEKKDTPA